MTFKTYDDGTELNGTSLAAMIALSTVAALAAGVATVKIQNWKTDRWLKKTGQYHGK